MSDRPFYLIQPLLPSPLVAAAIHNGHDLRSTLLKRVKLTEAQRRYEEDAYTELFTHLSATRIVVGRSQFEVDLNRARGEAVYQRPEGPGSGNLEGAPASQRGRGLTGIARILPGRCGPARRGDCTAWRIRCLRHPLVQPSPRWSENGSGAQEGNPDDFGTSCLDRSVRGSLLDAAMNELSRHRVNGKTLDVRENIKFKGRQFPHWVSGRYGERGCAIAIELKKIFMDEWTGVVDPHYASELFAALAGTVPVVESELAQPPNCAGSTGAEGECLKSRPHDPNPQIRRRRLCRGSR